MKLADRYLMLSKPFDSHHNNISSSNENEQWAQNWVTLLSYLHTQPTCFLALFFSPPCAPNQQHVLILDEASMIDGMLFEALDAFGREVHVRTRPVGGI